MTDIAMKMKFIICEMHLPAALQFKETFTGDADDAVPLMEMIGACSICRMTKWTMVPK